MSATTAEITNVTRQSTPTSVRTAPSPRPPAAPSWIAAPNNATLVTPPVAWANTGTRHDRHAEGEARDRPARDEPREDRRRGEDAVPGRAQHDRHDHRAHDLRCALRASARGSRRGSRSRARASPTAGRRSQARCRTPCRADRPRRRRCRRPTPHPVQPGRPPRARAGRCADSTPVPPRPIPVPRTPRRSFQARGVRVSASPGNAASSQKTMTKTMAMARALEPSGRQPRLES